MKEIIAIFILIPYLILGTPTSKVLTESKPMIFSSLDDVAEKIYEINKGPYPPEMSVLELKLLYTAYNIYTEEPAHYEWVTTEITSLPTFKLEAAK